jgi:hypothetical protein
MLLFFWFITVIAWALAMTSLGAISLGSFQTAAILLGGLFFYDIFWVRTLVGNEGFVIHYTHTLYFNFMSIILY